MEINEVKEWLCNAVEKEASDIFIGVGRSISFKIDGTLIPQGENILRPPDAEEILTALYEMSHRSMTKYIEKGDDDFPVSIPNVARFRVSAYRQRGTMAAIIRVVLFDIPDYTEFNIPDEVMKIASENHGLVLVTGAAGSGKTTTLACIIHAINQSRNCHIITLEDPIEFLHKDKSSLISQREISTDTESYLSALRACLRQAPDIILLGEMRDYETIKAAMTAAETGHLIISTLHTIGAVSTIDRIIDVFPSEQQQQVRVQLPMILRTVVTQQLLPTINGGLVPAYEIMHLNTAIRNLIREAKTHQIDGIIQTSAHEGMLNMDTSIFRLYQSGTIAAETAITYAINSDQMARKVKI